jgi:hypothetical protein
MKGKGGIPAAIYTQLGTIYTILGIASCLAGRQAGRGSWPAVVLGHGLLRAFAKSLPIHGFIHGLDKPIA